MQDRRSLRIPGPRPAQPGRHHRQVRCSTGPSCCDVCRSGRWCSPLASSYELKYTRFRTFRCQVLTQVSPGPLQSVARAVHPHTSPGRSRNGWRVDWWPTSGGDQEVLINAFINVHASITGTESCIVTHQHDNLRLWSWCLCRSLLWRESLSDGNIRQDILCTVSTSGP